MGSYMDGKGTGFFVSFKSLCVRTFLGIVNFVFSLFERITRKAGDISSAAEILVLRTAALGDFVLSIPALQLLRAEFPSAKITLLTAASTDKSTLRSVEAYSRNTSPWLGLLPDGVVDEIVTFSVAPLSRFWHRRLEILSGKSFNKCFIVTEGIGLTLLANAKKILFLRILGVRCKIYGAEVRAYPKIFPSVQRGEGRLEHHMISIMRSFEKADFGNRVPGDVAIPYIRPTPASVIWLSDFLRKKGIDARRLAIIAPGARLDFKRWPEKSFSKLIARLLVEDRVHIVLVGSGPELEAISRVRNELQPEIARSPLLHDLAGVTSIEQLTALLKHAGVFVGNDGGTCHLAAAVGCRVVSISNGAEFSNSVEPWNNQRFTARHEVRCSPCYCFTHCPLGDNKCVTGIHPDAVHDLVIQALNEIPEQAYVLANGV
jgi:heptosyltransferase-2